MKSLPSLVAAAALMAVWMVRKGSALPPVLRSLPGRETKNVAGTTRSSSCVTPRGARGTRRIRERDFRGVPNRRARRERKLGVMGGLLGDALRRGRVK